MHFSEQCWERRLNSEALRSLWSFLAVGRRGDAGTAPWGRAGGISLAAGRRGPSLEGPLCNNDYNEWLLFIESSVVLSSVLSVILNSLNNFVRWVFLLTTLLRFTAHSIQLSLLKGTVPWLLVFSQTCATSHSVSEHSVTPERNSVPLVLTFPHLHALSPRQPLIYSLSL